MSKTWRDRKKIKTVLEIVRRDGGTFDLIIDHQLDQTQTPERWLPEWLCVRFGFCGEEYDAIVRELIDSGRVTITF